MTILLIGLCAFSIGCSKREVHEETTMIDEVQESVTDISLNGETKPQSLDENTYSEKIELNLLDKETIVIEKDRTTGNWLGNGYLDNCWEKEEIDAILNAIEGNWQVDKYMGFIYFRIFDIDLLDDYNGDDAEFIRHREELFEKYHKAVETAGENIPELTFSVKKRLNYNDNWVNAGEHYIYVNGKMECPIVIKLSMDKQNDMYPICDEETVYSSDFEVEYPVLYIKFYYRNYKMEESGEIGERVYQPATLIITSDNQFFILINGAFYSLKQLDLTQDDFAVSDGVDTIALNTPCNKVTLQRKLLEDASANPTAEIVKHVFNEEYKIYHIYHYVYDGITIYYYDLNEGKNAEDIPAYCINQIRITDDSFSTSREIHVGSNKTEVIDAYGKGNVSRENDGIQYSYYYEDMAVWFIFDESDCVKEIRYVVYK